MNVNVYSSVTMSSEVFCDSIHFFLILVTIFFRNNANNYSYIIHSLNAMEINMLVHINLAVECKASLHNE